MDYKPSVVFVTRIDSEGQSQVLDSVDALFGAKVFSVCGCPAKDAIFALTDKGVCNLSSSEYVSNDVFKSMVCGSDHFLALSPSNHIYTWGQGSYGELGQGIHRVMGEYPEIVQELADIKSFSSGKNHAVAVDSKGIAYSWGQNFNKQLGVYKKATSALMERGGSVEEVLFRPRLVPISLTSRITRIGCGDTFTVAVTERGTVFSWGSGESGQLGNGRVSCRELPTPVQFGDIELDDKGFPKSSDDSIVDVACGFGHVLALTRGGSMYGWGFNKRSQLGLGDTATRHAPEKVPLKRFSSLPNDQSDKPVFAMKVFAEGHSSAFISSDGELYTFGSNLHNRLALKTEDIQASLSGYLGRDVSLEEIDASTRIIYPSLVSSLINCVVSFMSMAKTQSAIMVYTQIMGIVPSLIPHRNCSLLTLNGCGFYPSEDVVVKFVPFEYGPNNQVIPTGLAPRSCTATVKSSSEISLVPPRLHDKGLYYLLLSLDGGQLGAGDTSNFINQPGSIVVQVHRELTVTSLEPRIVDSRSSNGPVTCFVNVLNADCLDIKTVFTVKVTIKMFKGEGGEAIEVVDYLDGALIPLENPVADDSGDQLTQPDASLEGSSSILEDTRSSSHGKDKKPIEMKIKFAFNYYKYVGNEGNPIMTVIAQVSVNKYDYSVVTSSQSPIIFHSFTPKSTSTLCLPYDSSSDGSREISVFGESFIPKVILPHGLEIFAECSIEVESEKKKKPPSKGKVAKAADDSANSTNMVDYVPCQCPSSGEMIMSVPTWLQMKKTSPKKMTEKERTAAATDSATVLLIRFVLQSKIVSTNNKGVEEVTYNRQLMCEQPLSILLINPTCSISSSLDSFKRDLADVTMTTTISPNGSKPFDFLSNKAKIQLYSKESRQFFYTLQDSEYEFFDANTNATIDKAKINNATLPSFLSPSFKIRLTIPSLNDLNKITSYSYPTEAPAPQEGDEGAVASSEAVAEEKTADASPEDVDNNENSEVVAAVEEVPQEPATTPLDTPFEMISLPEIYIYFSFDTTSAINPATAPVDRMAKISLYSGCILSAAVVVPGAPIPKGGNPGLAPGATVTLPATNLVKWMTNDLAKARIKGLKPEVYADCSVTINPDTSSVNLTIPDLASIQVLEPEMKGKEKWYYVEMSVDRGQTYDCSEAAIIQLAVK